MLARESNGTVEPLITDSLNSYIADFFGKKMKEDEIVGHSRSP